MSTSAEAHLVKILIHRSQIFVDTACEFLQAPSVAGQNSRSRLARSRLPGHLSCGWSSGICSRDRVSVFAGCILSPGTGELSRSWRRGFCSLTLIENRPEERAGVGPDPRRLPAPQS